MISHASYSTYTVIADINNFTTITGISYYTTSGTYNTEIDWEAIELKRKKEIRNNNIPTLLKEIDKYEKNTILNKTKNE